MQVFLTVIVVSFLFSFFLSDWTPWYLFTLVGFLSGIFQGKRALFCFIAGFLAIFFNWLSMAAYLDTLSESRLTLKVSSMLGLNSKYILFFATASLGGILGGLSTLSGFYFQMLFNKRI